MYFSAACFLFYPTQLWALSDNEDPALLQCAHVGPSHSPCVVHQTWKSHELSVEQQSYAETWQKKNPGCEYRLWNDTELAELCRTKSPKMWSIWESLSPVQRADVFRYLVLWDQGGYYADIDVRLEKPIAEFPVPKDVLMIAGYEAGRRLAEEERKRVKFARVEQFQQWFLASAPRHPVLLRCLDIVHEKFLWKIQNTIDLTGPGSFSDAVHEFLAQGTSKELHLQQDVKAKRLSFPSETEYGSGEWNIWLLASGRTEGAGYAIKDDNAEPLLWHNFSHTWTRWR